MIVDIERIADPTYRTPKIKLYILISKRYKNEMNKIDPKVIYLPGNNQQLLLSCKAGVVEVLGPGIRN